MNFLSELFNSFNWKFAFRDAKPQWRSLLLYTSAIVAGVAALVAILSFRSDILLTVNDQSRELLGADLELRSSQPFPDSVDAYIDSIGGADSEAYEFNSMILIQKTGTTRLSQIRAIDGEYPFYGTLETIPEDAANNYQKNGRVLLEESFMNQLNLSSGDSIRVGNQMLAIEGSLVNVPGEAAAFSLIGPRVYLAKSIVEDSGLLQRGSRLEYKSYFKIQDEETLQRTISELRPIARENRVRLETVQSRQNDFSNIVDNLSKFLGLIAFIALLLGGLGVMSAVYVYIKRKTKPVATLRCLGMKKEKILAIYAIQIAGVGFLGAVIGSLIGLLIQFQLPLLFNEFLPFTIIQSISIQAILLGVFVGVLISVAFSILPIAALSGISPMSTLRSQKLSPIQLLNKKTKFISLLILVIIMTGIISVLIESLISGALFTIGLMLSVTLLWLFANLLMMGARALRLKSFKYVWRQGIANLFRPNNQTGMLMTTIGMGMLLIGSLYLSKEILLEPINAQIGDEVPNLVFYDVQSDQNESVNSIIRQNNGIIQQNVPIVSMRLQEWNGRSIQDVRSDTTLNLRGWALGREYRVTYRSELSETESILEGEWIGESDGLNSVVPISVAEQIVDNLKLSLNDSLTFNVQGIPVKTVVKSIREVDFSQPQPNFFILFPAGVLEQAPQFFATIVNTPGENDALAIQQAVVNDFSNISVIDVSLTLKSVRAFLDKISLAIQFMAFFSIITGFIVLTSSVSISRKQREKESILLRTLGAAKQQVQSIQTIEYALLGILSSLTGLLLAVGASWILSVFYFDLPFVPDAGIPILIAGIVVLATVAIGWMGSRQIFKYSPLEVLRMQTR